MLESADIFIVEDEALIAGFMTVFLEAAGHTVVGSAGTVSDAIEKIKDTSPDLVSLDYNLGNEKSSEIVNYLQRINVPYIFCCADPKLATLETNSPSAQYVVKPFRKSELLDCVKRALKRHGVSKSEYVLTASMFSSI